MQNINYKFVIIYFKNIYSTFIRKKTSRHRIYKGMGTKKAILVQDNSLFWVVW